ncbi:MAG: CpsD/CapB family tyrosine-protein kinase [Pseudomonadota bacterium]
MERLHDALEKVRNDRSGARPPDPGVGGSGADRPRAATPLAELATLSLDQAMLEAHRIFAAEASEMATSFDILRTRTLRLMQAQGWKRIAVTSATPGCGKSTIALNLAFAMARQRDTRTLQIELDMRHPAQQALLGIGHRHLNSGDGPTTVAQFFRGERDFTEIAHRHGEGLGLAINGTTVPDASDVLLAPDIDQRLRELELRYAPDMMIFDMPPVLANDDVIAFTKHVDCVLIIAAADATTSDEVDRCERELAAMTNVLGVVLNKSRLGALEAYGPY